MTDPATTLDRLAARAGQLYSLPAVAVKVLELTNNPDVDARQLKECIENDPALTGKILRVVNSSLFGLSRQVTDLNQALALLGTKPLKLLVLGFSLPAGLFAEVAGEVLGRYWRHTLTKAVAGREISEKLWDMPGDDAFVAGLLQDVGMLLLIQELGEPYVRFLRKVLANGKDLAALEIESTGFDHTMLSARLLAHWGLPPALIAAIAQPHDGPLPSEGVNSELPQILHLAELVARLLADQQPGVLGELLSVGRRYRDLSAEQLQSLVEHLQERVGQLADVFNLQLPEGLDYRDILLQAHAQLSAVATETAQSLLRGEQAAACCTADESLRGELLGVSEAVSKFAWRPSEAATATEPAPQLMQKAMPPSASRSGEMQARDARPLCCGEPCAAAMSSSTPVDQALLSRLAVAVAACRQSRRPVSLLLVEIDHFEELANTCPQGDVDFLRRALESTCRGTDHALKMCLTHGDAGFALVLPNCERRLAVELGNQLLAGFRRLVQHDYGRRYKGVSLSVGAAAVALPPKNFPPEDLFTGASRCLYGSHASGGGVVKSIEIY